jgi:hypothetical protein
MTAFVLMHVQEMNVEGLTRENVASHLQKWRLQNKRWEPRDDPLGPGLGPVLPQEASPPDNNTKPQARSGRDATVAAGGQALAGGRNPGPTSSGGEAGDAATAQEIVEEGTA